MNNESKRFQFPEFPNVTLTGDLETLLKPRKIKCHSYSGSSPDRRTLEERSLISFLNPYGRSVAHKSLFSLMREFNSPMFNTESVIENTRLLFNRRKQIALDPEYIKCGDLNAFLNPITQAIRGVQKSPAVLRPTMDS